MTLNAMSSMNNSHLINESHENHSLSKANSRLKEAANDESPMTSGSRRDTRESGRIALETESFIERMKREKEEKRLAEMQEKKRDLDQLIKYDPWGRPGGGAPRMDDNRMKKFTEMDLKLDVKHQGNLEGLKLYRPGAGAPLINESGALKTQISSDPTLRHNNSDRRKEHSHRYCIPKEEADELRAELKKAELQKTQREETERIWNLHTEKNLWNYHPYGKPGAGAPNISQPPTARMSSPCEEDSAPWGYGTGPPKTDSFGNFHRPPGHVLQQGQMMHPRDQIDPKWERLEGVETTLAVGLSRGAGAPILNDDGKAVTRLKNSLVYKQGKVSIDDLCQDNVNSPGRTNPGFLGFGSPGGGAPITDRSGHQLNGFRDEIFNPEDRELKNRLNKSIMKEKEREMVIRELMKRKREQEYHGGPNLSLAAQMMKSKTGKPQRDIDNYLYDHHRVRTDIGETERKSPRRTEETPIYQTELLSQIQEREKMMEMSRKLSAEQSNHHYEESPRVYGRPGGGAPLHPKDHRKPNLLNLLQNCGHSNNSDPESSYRIPISDGYSTHANQYEYVHRDYNNKEHVSNKAEPEMAMLNVSPPPYATTSGR